MLVIACRCYFETDEMGKGKEISTEVRKLILKLFLENKSLREIGKIIGKTHSSVQNIINLYQKNMSLRRKPRCGRPKKLSQRDERKIVNAVKVDPKISAPKIREELLEDTQTSVHPQTIRNVLHRAGYNARIPRRKPLISAINKKKRLDFAKEHLDKPDSFWDKVVFSDESKYNIFGPDGPKKVWRKPNEAMLLKNILPTVKHGGGNVMVWGCMAGAGAGRMVFVENTMDKYVYLNILRENLKESALKLGLDEKSFLFQQDNDPKHTSYLVKEWLLYNCKQLHTPPQSPDLNPIEHIWDLLEKRIRKHKITSKESLKNALSAEWGKLTDSDTKKLVRSMHRRLQAVIDAGGGPTRY